ncbi:hypothetical protein AB1Y20_022416 [Prymnesium parvum]|uniref:Protein-tyrosine sulfotransferase n=1 Tax=Prymnesium parvum TaxID=97485 RepID=A0AB34JIX2_PRYPA
MSALWTVRPQPAVRTGRAPLAPLRREKISPHDARHEERVQLLGAACMHPGGSSWAWGMEWYEGLDLPLSSWEWEEKDAPRAHGATRRRGEGEEAGARRRGPPACHRFPLECLHGRPIVRPGCGLSRPLPSHAECARGIGGACRPRAFVSHAWPRAAEVSPRALVLDPSINTLMNAVDAPRLLRLHAAASPRFIVILRDPVARAASSARMMSEWKWEKAANLSAALEADLARLNHCIRQRGFHSSPAAVAAQLWSLHRNRSSTASGADGREGRGDARLTQLRHCLARGAPLNHVRSGLYAVGAVAWLQTFAPDRFLWLETDSLRAASAVALLRLIAEFAQLPTYQLNDLPARIHAACERRRGALGLGESSSSSSTGAKLLEDTRMAEHVLPALPASTFSALQQVFKPFNFLMGRLLDGTQHLQHVEWLHPAEISWETL